ncbi:MAG: aldehyde dehydrogenase family protein [Sphingomonas bacterium]|nr:aldehyde dehydrogenase family protein [Sphingomonas bacterium]
MSCTAFLLIDLQEEYLAHPGLEPRRETLVANIAAALAKARASGEPIFHIRTDNAAMPHRKAAPDATPPRELAGQPGEPVFTKRFFSAFDAAGLADALTAAGITRLRLAGVHAHACIHATALDAYARGLEVEIDEALVGTDSPVHAAESLRWLNSRAASVITAKAEVWLHRDPCDQNRIISEVPQMKVNEIRQSEPAEAPAERLAEWHESLSSTREKWVTALIETIAKPRADAEAEVTYGLALLAHVITSLGESQSYDAPSVTHRPIGRAGLITPWNNPFAIPIGKLAPAIGFGNTALWKPALPGTAIAIMLRDSLAASGLADSVALITGGAATGRAMIERGGLDLLSFTGSVPVGRAIIAAAGHRALPVQAELGGCNAAIVDTSADLDSAATDLATAMFSFSGQRCTSIRRVILLADIAATFTDRLVAAVGSLRLGQPADPTTQVGPVIDRAAQQRFLALAGTSRPTIFPQAGCWVAPALLYNLPDDHPLLTEEIFGPLAAIQLARDLDHAIALHNASDFGLVGAIYTNDPATEHLFLAPAEAGMLSINRARPAFAASGPFVGWKASAFGPPEHGRWNRDVYTKPQAHYRPE